MLCNFLFNYINLLYINQGKEVDIMPIYRKEKSEWTKDGRSYYFRCYYTDIYGNKKQKESKLYKTRPEAKDAEAEFLIKIKSNDEIDKNVDFETVYREWYIYKSRTLKCTTAYKLKKSLDKNILAYFKPYKLNNIKINIITPFYNFLEIQKLSPKYQNKMIGYLKEILTYAVDNYEYDKKIVSKITKKRITSIENQQNSEWNFWTYDEFNLFINNVDNEFWYIVFNFMYFTGLRIGEFIALTWEDINFENKTIRINKSFTNKSGDKNIHIVDPKTSNSIRTIDMDDNLFNLILKHYETEKNIYNFNKNMFIFGNITYTSPTTFARYLNLYIKKSSVKKITPHGFRHSHVSLLFYLGCDEFEIAERVGDTVEVVRKTYYHMFPSKKSNTVKALNNLKLH